MDDITRISSNEWLWYETKKMLLHCRERLDERRLDEERRSPTLRRAGRPIYYSATIRMSSISLVDTANRRLMSGRKIAPSAGDSKRDCWAAST